MKRKISILTAFALLIIIVSFAIPAEAAEWESGISTPSVSSVSSLQSSSSVQTYEDEVLHLINKQRVAYSLKPLTVTTAMNGIAAVRAKESSVLFSHTRPDGTSPASLFAQYEIAYSLAGENLAYGYTSPDTLVSAWMSSTEHRSNILNANFEYTGIGVYQSSEGKIYCAQSFYRP